MRRAVGHTLFGKQGAGRNGRNYIYFHLIYFVWITRKRVRSVVLTVRLGKEECKDPVGNLNLRGGEVLK
jgi:hypothetical protein